MLRWWVYATIHDSYEQSRSEFKPLGLTIMPYWVQSIQLLAQPIFEMLKLNRKLDRIQESWIRTSFAFWIMTTLAWPPLLPLFTGSLPGQAWSTCLLWLIFLQFVSNHTVLILSMRWTHTLISGKTGLPLDQCMGLLLYWGGMHIQSRKRPMYRSRLPLGYWWLDLMAMDI